MGEKALQNYSWKTILAFHYSRLCIFWKSCLVSRYCCKFITAIKIKNVFFKKHNSQDLNQKKNKRKKKPKNKKLKITSRGYVTMYLKVEIFCAGLSFNLIFSFFFDEKQKKKLSTWKITKARDSPTARREIFLEGNFQAKEWGKERWEIFFIPAARLLEVLEHFYLREENRKWQ